MPRRQKSKKLKQLEEKLKIVKREIAKRKKLQSAHTPSKSKRSKKPTKSPFEECQNIIDRLKKMQYSRAFLEPVNWKQLNIPSYPDIISQPMDLSTVETKLNTGKYSSPYQLAADMRLIYQNACVFNKPGTPYYIAGTKFAKKFEEEFEKKIVDIHETNDFTKKIAKVAATLMRREEAAPFRMPVDPTVLEIPDYFQIIEEPMDLGTILNRIQSYKKFKKFAADLYLVWDNCTKYNPKQNAIHQIALKLREYTTKQLSKLCQTDFDTWQENEGYSPEPYPMSTLSITVPEHTDSIIEDIKPQHPITSTHTTLAPGPSVNLQSDSDQNNVSQEQPMDSQDIEMTDNISIQPPNTEIPTIETQENHQPDIFRQCDEMTDEEEANRMMINHLLKNQELDPDTHHQLNFQQKEELQRGIQCLDSDHFDPLINMLQSFIPEGEGDDDEVELDVDAIDDPLQVKMYNYMLQAINQQEKERIQREGGDVNNIINMQPPQSQVITMNNPNMMEIEHQSQHEEEEHNPDINDMNNMNDMNNINNINNTEDIQDNEERQEQQAMDTDHDAQPINMSTAFPTDNNQEVIVNDAASYTFGPTVNATEITQDMSNINEQQQPQEDNMEEEDDEDVDMVNHEDMEQIEMNQDIVADIANEIEATDNSQTMPVLESGNDINNEEGDDAGNDNDITDTEINDNDDNVTPQSTANVTPNNNPIVPTMPELQPEDAVEDIEDGDNTDNNQENANMETGDEHNNHNKIPTMESMEDQMATNGGKDDEMSGEGMNHENLSRDEIQREIEDEDQDTLQEEQEDADTLLADEIDF